MNLNNTIKKSTNLSTKVVFLLFLIGILANNIIWFNLYLQNTICILGASSRYVSSTTNTAIINESLKNSGKALYKDGLLALEGAGYKNSFPQIMLNNIPVTPLIILVIFVLSGVICLLICKHLSVLANEQIIRLSIWANSDDSDNLRFTLIPSEILEIITNLKHKIAKLDQLHKEDNSRLAEYIEDISHQLKTPLSVLRSICERSITLYPPVNDSMNNCILQIDKMTELIQHLLISGRLECGKIKAKFTYISPSILMETLKNDFAFMLEENNMTMDIISHTNKSWFCDEFWIMQILDNIVTNAIKHSNAQGKITISYDSSNTENTIVIYDDGIGFTNNTENKIFERFSSCDRTGKESAGLGLYIAKQAINLHFGTITASNHVPAGAEFRISFPRFDAESVYQK